MLHVSYLRAPAPSRGALRHLILNVNFCSTGPIPDVSLDVNFK